MSTRAQYYHYISVLLGNCGVDMIVILELCKREEVVPIVLSLINKEAEELLQLLIDPFHLSISLGVVCGGGCQLNSKKLV